MADVRIEYVETNGGSNVMQKCMLSQAVTVTAPTSIESVASPAGADMAFIRVTAGTVYFRLIRPGGDVAASDNAVLLTTQVPFIPVKVTEGDVFSITEL